MKFACWSLIGLVLVITWAAGCVTRTASPTPSDRELARRILADPELPATLEKAHALLRTGLTAGSGYGEVWIRDLNTFIEVSLEVADRERIRDALLMFLSSRDRTETYQTGSSRRIEPTPATITAIPRSRPISWRTRTPSRPTRRPRWCRLSRVTSG